MEGVRRVVRLEDGLSDANDDVDIEVLGNANMGWVFDNPLVVFGS